jgi:hypothetical protein
VHPVCVLEMLIATGLGFLIGSRSKFGPSAYSARENAVLAARYYASTRPPRPLPALPRSIFYASLFLAILLLRGLCPHLTLFVWLSFACALSSGAWLLMASNLQESADEKRQARIDEFVGDPNSPVPEPVPGLETPPPQLKRWQQFNVGLFLLILIGLVLLVRIA